MKWLIRILPLLQLVRQGDSKPLLLRSALRDIAILVASVVLFGMLLAAMALTALAGIYQLLLAEGVTASGALMVVLSLALAVMLLALGVGLGAIRRLYNIPRLIQRSEHPIQNFLSSVSDAFMAGYNGKSKTKTRKR